MAKEIVPVGGDVDLELSTLAETSLGDFFGGVIVELDPELEAKLVKLLGGVGAPERLVKVLFVDSDGRHGCERYCGFSAQPRGIVTRRWRISSQTETEEDGDDAAEKVKVKKMVKRVLTLTD